MSFFLKMLLECTLYETKCFCVLVANIFLPQSNKVSKLHIEDSNLSEKKNTNLTTLIHNS